MRSPVVDRDTDDLCRAPARGVRDALLGRCRRHRDDGSRSALPAHPDRPSRRLRHRPCRAADLDRGRRPLASRIGRLGTAWFARYWLSAGHLLRQPSECAGAGQDPAAGPRDNPRHRWRAHAASLSIAKLVFGAEKASRDQAGRAPRWRLLEARRPGVDIIAGASLARRTVNLPLSIVKIRLWLPGRFVVARSAAVSKKCCPLRGTKDSNPLSSSGEPIANPTFSIRTDGTQARAGLSRSKR